MRSRHTGWSVRCVRTSRFSTEIELAVVAPVDDDNEDITVDRYPLDTVVPWTDDEGENPGQVFLWLVGGDDEDVEVFLEAVDADEDEAEHDHDHGEDGHQH